MTNPKVLGTKDGGDAKGRTPPNDKLNGAEEPSWKRAGAQADERAARERRAQAERMHALWFPQAGAITNRYKLVMTTPDATGKVLPEVDKKFGAAAATVDHMVEHLSGAYGYGAGLPPKGAEFVTFGVHDLDDYLGSEIDYVRVFRRVRKLALPLMLHGTKSGGARLVLFSTVPVHKDEMTRAVKAIAGRLGLRIRRKKNDTGGTEIIVASNVWLPYCGAKCPGFEIYDAPRGRNYRIVSLSEWLDLAEKSKVTPDRLEELAKATKDDVEEDEEDASAASVNYATARLKELCDGLAGMQDGRNWELNSLLFQMGGFIREKLIDEETVWDQVLAAAAACQYRKGPGEGYQGDEATRQQFAHSLKAGKEKAKVRREVGKADSVAVVKWRDYARNGETPRPSLANTVLAMRALGIECRLDLFHLKTIVEYRGSAAPVRHFAGGDVSDNMIGAIRSLINNTFLLDPGDANVLAAVAEIARDSAFDPVRDYLDTLTWDGAKRLDTWMIDYCGAPDTPFVRAVGRMHMVASVRRARVPGCKYDCILVLESPEGQGKSSAVELLAGRENFSDQTILGASDKTVQELVTGVWLYEIADLTDIAKADVNRVKAFASRVADRARPAYGHIKEDRPRRCTFWASTNDKQYLKSQTGNRRFLPVPVGRIKLEALRRDRDQLWAEAAAAEADGESIFLPESLWDVAAEEQEKRREIDPWEEVLANIPEELDAFIDDCGQGPPPPRAGGIRIIFQVTNDNGEIEERVASADLLTLVLRVPIDRQTTAHANRLSTIMRRLGWERTNSGVVRIDGRAQRGYFRPVKPMGDG
jgi:predicted P-loop ATPase